MIVNWLFIIFSYVMQGNMSYCNIFVVNGRLFNTHANVAKTLSPSSPNHNSRSGMTMLKNKLLPNHLVLPLLYMQFCFWDMNTRQMKSIHLTAETKDSHWYATLIGLGLGECIKSWHTFTNTKFYFIKRKIHT